MFRGLIMDDSSSPTPNVAKNAHNVDTFSRVIQLTTIPLVDLSFAIPINLSFLIKLDMSNYLIWKE